MASPCALGTDPVVSGIVALASFALPFGILQRELAIIHRGNAVTTMTNAVLAASVTVVAFFFVGYGFSNGFEANRNQQQFIGERYFFLINRDPCAFMDVLSELARALTVVFIIVGAVTERIHTHAVGFLAGIVSAFIYAVPRYWTAGDNSWLVTGNAHLQDTSGNASMFVMAGVMAAVVLKFTGARIASAGGTTAVMNQPTSLVSSTGLQAIGGVFLLGFSSLRRANQTGDVIPVEDNPAPRSILAAVNLVVSLGLGGVTAITLHQLFADRWSHLPPSFTVRLATAGAISAMVAVSGFAGVTFPEVVIPVAIAAGAVSRSVMLALLRANIDDATDAIPIYLVGGLLGLITAPFWDEADGIFYHVGEWDGLGWNILAMVCIIAWCSCLTALICLFLQAFNALSFAKPHLQDPRGLDVSLFAVRASDGGHNDTQLTLASLPGARGSGGDGDRTVYMTGMDGRDAGMDASGGDAGDSTPQQHRRHHNKQQQQQQQQQGETAKRWRPYQLQQPSSKVSPANPSPLPRQTRQTQQQQQQQRHPLANSNTATSAPRQQQQQQHQRPPHQHPHRDYRVIDTNAGNHTTTDEDDDNDGGVPSIITPRQLYSHHPAHNINHNNNHNDNDMNDDDSPSLPGAFHTDDVEV
ncbi:hypothetical protein PTSG_07323 [Salpingoeca rosetta]|uniref:Ammonium transporter AmtB-like domain-containing protein n=1 Tax=Salpingoeca rosetta (strain ATCC 50818 / BSB-021) TaxID=946362 RepID=F2UJ32_SALR5|nr:uncharacterized protein PTSG_07323 [Salpingoeca rosetta]EGD76980.1 hypothetical protein PTSG_07323 [Salpingoeca rosetta]|eukprot:XP_004990820.1 hypothetical protein PTSG_07323 [Salpingoeca rosetta]